MSVGRAHAITWTETAHDSPRPLPTSVSGVSSVNAPNQLATSPEQQGKPLIGQLAGFRSVRAVGQRYRIVYHVERREITVLIVAVGRRRSGDKSDIYELARKLLRQRLLH